MLFGAVREAAVVEMSALQEKTIVVGKENQNHDLSKCFNITYLREDIKLYCVVTRSYYAKTIMFSGISIVPLD